MTQVIGNSYDFDVYPSVILGNQFKNFKLVAILDAETTRMLQFDPAAMHTKVYPTLPDGSIDDYLQYSYYKYLTPTNEVVIIGEPWIKPNSVVAVTSDYLWVKVLTTPDQVSGVRSSLVSNGYSVDKVQVGGTITP